MPRASLERLSDGARRRISLGLVLAAFASVLVLSTFQVHPGAWEPVISSLLLLGGLIFGAVIAPKDGLRRIAPFVLGALFVLIGLAWWHPTNLVVFTLLVDHPAIFLLTVVVIVERSYVSGRAPATEERAKFALGVLAAGTVAYGCILWFGGVDRPFRESIEPLTGGPRIDTHEGGWDGGCVDSHSVLRVGSGLGLSEVYLGNACQGSVVFDRYRLPGDAPGAAHIRSNTLTCYAGMPDLLVIEFDPKTLAGAEAALPRCS